MDENRMKEIEERILFLMGSPSQPPNAETDEDLAEVEKLSKELEELKIQAINSVSYTSIIPKKSVLSVSKVAKKTCELINGNAGGVFVDKKKKVAVTLSVIPENVKLPEQYTPFDYCIHEAVCTLIQSGNKVFSAEMVYRAMNGLTNTQYVTPQAVAAVTKSIMKQRHIDVFIDCSKDPDFKDGVKAIQEAVIPCKIIYAKINGSITQVFMMYAQPPIYWYSSLKKQVRYLDIKLFNIFDLRSSEQITTIKFYLLQQIESMKGKNGRNKTIRFDTIMQDCKLKFSPSNPAKDIKKYRDYIKKMLNYWIECGYISGYKENKNGRAFESVTISLPDKK